MNSVKEEQIWILKQEQQLLQDEVERLKEELEFEKICSKIDRHLDKDKYDRLAQTTLEISRDYLKHVENNPVKFSEYAEYSDYCSDDEGDECDDCDKDSLIDVEDWCDRYKSLFPELVSEIKEVFRI